jgi:phosphate transport system protein
VDDLFEIVKKELAGYIKANIENTDQAITFMMIAKYLERIGDHAVNICEWASYNINGIR